METERNTKTENREICINSTNLSRDWNVWKSSLQETLNDVRDDDPSEGNVIGYIEDMRSSS